MFTEFPYPTYEQWRKAAEKLLRGESFEDNLVTETYEGISLQPIYVQEHSAQLPQIGAMPGMDSFVRGTSPLGYVSQPWEICQELRYSSAEDFNEAAHYDLEQGQTMLHLTLDPVGLRCSDPDECNKEEIGQGGISISFLPDLDCALEDISLEKTPIFIHTGSLVVPLLSMIIAHMEHKGENVTKLRGCVGTDPIGNLVQQGTISVSLNSAFINLAQTMVWAKQHMPHLQTVSVQGGVYHDSGGSAVEELGFVLATGVEYLRKLQDLGLSVDDIASRMVFSFSIGSNFFMEIAKLRAARYMWANVVKAFGGCESALRMNIHGRTSAWTKTLYDPHVNILRSTTEAFAGVMGGVKSLHVSPMDEVTGSPTEFSRRIARNIQIILKEEAHVARVVDPAGGSWYIETLTDSLAQKGWALLQEVESHGGIIKALQKGFPQERVSAVASQKKDAIRRGEHKFVGTNCYPESEEAPISGASNQMENFQRDRVRALSVYRDSLNSGQHHTAMQSLMEALKAAAQEQMVDAAVQAVRCGATLGDLANAIRKLDEGGEILQIKALYSHRGAEIVEALRKHTEEGALA